MTLVSRAALLRLLESRPEAEHQRLAARLGFGYRSQAETPDDLVSHRGGTAPDRLPGDTPTLATLRKDHRYWTLAECSAIDQEIATEEFDPVHPGKAIDDTAGQAITSLPRRPLLNAGEWHNCWDRALPLQRSGRAIDLPRTVRRLARGEPVRRLVRKQRKNRNHSSVLILDAGPALRPALRPVWRDMHDAWTSLRELLIERLQRLDQLDAETRQRLHRAVRDWQASLAPTAQEIESLQGQLHRHPSSDGFPRLHRLASLAHSELRDQMGIGQAYRLMVSLLPVAEVLADTQVSARWRELLQAAQRVALDANQTLPLKHQGLRSTGESRWLRQIDNALLLGENPGRALLALGSQPYCVQTRRPLEERTRPRGDTLEIIDQGRYYYLRALRQPSWAERLWCDGNGLYAAHSGGAVFHLPPASPEQPHANWACVHQPWALAGAAGIDKYGLWADLQVKDLRYRLRWIPPGDFLMGSPPDEPERYDGEIQHQVRLIRGYWLGETSCPQDLWQAVMGENPSHDKGAELPVGNISWNDCQAFLDKLKELAPDLPLGLPSEAQWEYACRAGTRTAYWWGDEYDEKYANNGYKTKREGDYRANPYGLKSMSGNLSEWCADWLGDYPSEALKDPAGPEEGLLRVLRGGSWISDGRGLRSADRDANAPDLRNQSFGLRLAGGFDPQASGRAMTADGRPWSGRRGGGQGPDAVMNSEDRN